MKSEIIYHVIDDKLTNNAYIESHDTWTITIVFEKSKHKIIKNYYFIDGDEINNFSKHVSSRKKSTQLSSNKSKIMRVGAYSPCSNDKYEKWDFNNVILNKTCIVINCNKLEYNDIDQLFETNKIIKKIKIPFIDNLDIMLPINKQRKNHLNMYPPFFRIKVKKTIKINNFCYEYC